MSSVARLVFPLAVCRVSRVSGGSVAGHMTLLGSELKLFSHLLLGSRTVNFARLQRGRFSKAEDTLQLNMRSWDICIDGECFIV